MASEQQGKMLVGLDIGTSKVVAIVGALTVDGGIEIVGVGTHVSRGLKKGVVVNIESTVDAIHKAVREAELIAGCNIHSVYAGIAGSHIQSQNSNGVVAVRGKEITEPDMDRVLDAARAVAIPQDRRTIHVLPQDYSVDDQEGIHEPVGMAGVRLEARVHLISAAVNAAQNIDRCIQRCNLVTEELVLEQLASSYATLTEDERQLGVCMVDIGGGTTDIAIFAGGAIRYTSVIPIAGDQVTNDIATALLTPTQEAENLKIKYACALQKLTDEDELINVPSVGDRPPRQLSRLMLAEVIEPRYEELFQMVLEDIEASGYAEHIPAGIVLTGGTAKMEGAVDLAEEIFHMPVRLATPKGISGLVEVVDHPMYSTAVGLLLYAAKQQKNQPAAEVEENNESGIFSRMAEWIKGNF